MNWYKALVIMGISSPGFFYGYDMCLIKIVQLMDPFRLYFSIGTWDGDYRNKYGTQITEANSGDTASYRDLSNHFSDAFEFCISWSYIVGAIIGSLLSSSMADKVGRKKALLYVCLSSFIGCIVSCLSLNEVMFYLGRLLIGISIGCITTICPVYLSETVPETERCKSSGAYYGMMVLGMLVSTMINSVPWYMSNHIHVENVEIKKVVDEDYNPIIGDSVDKEAMNVRNNKIWRLPFLIQLLVFAINYWIIYTIPNSPRWLSFIQRDNDAITLLKKMDNYSSNDDDEIKVKYDAIKDSTMYYRAFGQSSYKSLFKPNMRRRTFSTISLHIFQQWTCPVLFYYHLSRINVLSFLPRYVKVVVAPVVMIALAALIGITGWLEFAEKRGRKFLYLSTTLGLILLNLINLFVWRSSNPNTYFSTKSIFETYDDCKGNRYHDSEVNMDFNLGSCNSYGYEHFCEDQFHVVTWGSEETYTAPFKSNYTKHMERICNMASKNSSFKVMIENYTGILNIVSISIIIATWGCLPWIYKTEVFPMNLRTKGSAIGSITQFFSYGVVLSNVPGFLDGSLIFTFFILLLNNLVSIVITMIFCTETKGKTLEELENTIDNKEEVAVEESSSSSSFSSPQSLHTQ